MNKKGGRLTFPTDPLAAMRELSDLDDPARTGESDEAFRAYGSTEVREPVSTEARAYGDTDGRTDGSAEAREDASPHASTEASTGGREDGRTDASAEASPPVSTGGRAEARTHASKPVRKPAGKPPGPPGGGDLLAVVEATLESREPLVGGVKATLDMSPELSSRAKRYLADHRGQSTRQVLLALFDAFLTEKGY